VAHPGPASVLNQIEVHFTELVVPAQPLCVSSKITRGAHHAHGRQASLFNLLAVVFPGACQSFHWDGSWTLRCPYGRLNPFPPPHVVPNANAGGGGDLAYRCIQRRHDDAERRADRCGKRTDAGVDRDTDRNECADDAHGDGNGRGHGSTEQQRRSSLPRFCRTVTPAPSQRAQPSPTRPAYVSGPSCGGMRLDGHWRTVVDLQGKAAWAAYVHIWGLDNIDQVVVVGGNTNYGPSGWELRLARGQSSGTGLCNSSPRRTPSCHSRRPTRFRCPATVKGTWRWCAFNRTIDANWEEYDDEANTGCYRRYRAGRDALGGLVPGSTVLVRGAPGCGKTSLGLQFSSTARATTTPACLSHSKSFPLRFTVTRNRWAGTWPSWKKPVNCT